jgi:hypothetical protein
MSEFGNVVNYTIWIVSVRTKIGYQVKIIDHKYTKWDKKGLK